MAINGPIASSTGTLVVTKTAKGVNSFVRYVQTLYLVNRGGVYTRTDDGTHESDARVWKDWVRLDNFGCNTAEELASLLGAFGNVKTLPADTDCNTILTTGIYFFATTGSSTIEAMHKPSRNNCVVFCISYLISNGYYIMQFHIDQHINYGVHIRSKDQISGDWSDWAKLC